MRSRPGTHCRGFAVAPVPEGEEILEETRARLVTASADGVTVQGWRVVPQIELLERAWWPQ